MSSPGILKKQKYFDNLIYAQNSIECSFYLVGENIAGFLPQSSLCKVIITFISLPIYWKKSNFHTYTALIAFDSRIICRNRTVKPNNEPEPEPELTTLQVISVKHISRLVKIQCRSFNFRCNHYENCFGPTIYVVRQRSWLGPQTVLFGYVCQPNETGRGLWETGCGLWETRWGLWEAGCGLWEALGADCVFMKW